MPPPPNAIPAIGVPLRAGPPQRANVDEVEHHSRQCQQWEGAEAAVVLVVARGEHVVGVPTHLSLRLVHLLRGVA